MREMLYSRQAGYLVLLFLLGSSLIYVPESFISRDTWISTFLGSLVGLYILYILISLQKMFPGESIINISRQTLGVLPGTVLNIAFLAVVLLVAMLNLFDMITFLSIIYPFVPRYFLMLMLTLATALIVYEGITIAGRTVDLYTWLVLLFLTLSLLVLLPLFQASNLFPLLSEPGPVLLGAIYGADWPFAEVTLLALFFPYVIDLQQEGGKIYKWYLVAAGLLVVRAIFVQASLGPQLLAVSRFPFYDAIRLVQFADFQRIELFFFILFWTVTSSAVIISYRSLVLGLKEFFAISNYRVLILPVGLLIFSLSVYTFPSGLQFILREANTNAFITLPVHILYPTIIFLAARWRYRRLTLAAGTIGPGIKR